MQQVYPRSQMSMFTLFKTQAGQDIRRPCVEKDESCEAGVLNRRTIGMMSRLNVRTIIIRHVGRRGGLRLELADIRHQTPLLPTIHLSCRPPIVATTNDSEWCTVEGNRGQTCGAHKRGEGKKGSETDRMQSELLPTPAPSSFPTPTPLGHLEG